MHMGLHNISKIENTNNNTNEDLEHISPVVKGGGGGGRDSSLSSGQKTVKEIWGGDDHNQHKFNEHRIKTRDPPFDYISKVLSRKDYYTSLVTGSLKVFADEDGRVHGLSYVAETLVKNDKAL
jgi:hypothetical protein